MGLRPKIAPHIDLRVVSVPETPAVFGFVLLGGAILGATVRDIRLANELARRGHEVHVWWVFDLPPNPGLDAKIHQHLLFHAFRYIRSGKPSRILDTLGRINTAISPGSFRVRSVQWFPGLIDTMLRGLLKFVCGGVEKDSSLVRRFARQMDKYNVTHMLPSLEMLAPLVIHARRQSARDIKLLVTFQGYEIYANYARAIGLEQPLYARLRNVALESDFPAVAVSQDYSQRIQEDIGVPGEQLTVIPPGLTPARLMERSRAFSLLKQHNIDVHDSLPIVTYFGRVDTEKGLDLLLYAARMVAERGVKFQFVVCGPSAMGQHYRHVCRDIAEHLRLPVSWCGQISDEVRSALYRASRCVVYPSIHREPFGMVPGEAIAHGTPCIVPDKGGVTELARVGGEKTGLIFRAWDSGDLATQLHTVLTDEACWTAMSQAGLRTAAELSVERLGDRILEHMGVGVTR